MTADGFTSIASALALALPTVVAAMVMAAAGLYFIKKLLDATSINAVILSVIAAATTLQLG